MSNCILLMKLGYNLGICIDEYVLKNWCSSFCMACSLSYVYLGIFSLVSLCFSCLCVVVSASLLDILLVLL